MATESTDAGESKKMDVEGWGNKPASLTQMLTLFAYQFFVTALLVYGIFWAWPRSRSTERDRLPAVVDSAIKVALARREVPRGPAANSAQVTQAGAPLQPNGGQRSASDTTTALNDTSRRESTTLSQESVSAKRDSTAQQDPGENLRAIAFLVVVLCAGGLGTLFRGIGSLAWYSGTRTLLQSWLFNYYAQPLKGALLGLMFFFVFRAGLLATNTSVTDTNPAGFAALAALVGMFDREATKKLQQVAQSLFANADEKVDHTPADSPAGEQTVEKT
jgi:glycerol uptake facilitator-like aquaporin